MTSTTTFATPLTHKQQEQHLPLCKRRGGDGGRGSFRIKKCPQHLLAYSIISILVFLCWLPDFIVALKDVSVTIPQAVKRGSNAMLTCNYDMENDTLYSVKWYKGRREFYRYTPKENPAMKVFPSQSGLNVERNLSNQSHVVLLAVPLNISGKFTCEISVEAPSFQTAMVSGEMEVVELPEEQATVTGIQPRYRIGDLVDGNCSIKYSKPAANLTWTINGIVVPPHHIKTYQIEKYEETNLESVMSAVHFMVTTQHFIKGQMRLKCTASIFDIFKEEIESVIEEDRPRIMASGQSYPPDHGYGSHGDSDGYEHNESYLTYFSAPKSSASPTADFVLNNILKMFKHKALKISQHLNSLVDNITQNALTSTLVNKMKNSLDRINLINVLFLMLIKLISVFIILLVVLLLQIQQKNYLRKCLQKKMTVNRKIADNCIEMLIKIKENFLAMNLWPYTCYIEEKEQRLENGNCYQDANNDDCQAKCGQRQQQQQQYQQNEHCLVSNQNVINEENSPKETNITKTQWSSKNKTITAALTAIDGQQQMSQTHAFDTLFLTNAAILPPTAFTSSSCSLASTSLSLSTTLGYSKTYTHDSFPLYTVDASKSNNAKYMSKDQTLLMTSTASVTAAAAAVAAIVVVATSNSTYEIPSAFAPSTATATSTSVRALVLELNLLQTSVLPLLVIVKEETSIPSSLSSSSSSNSFSSLSPTFSRNNYLMAFIGELLLHQC